MNPRLNPACTTFDVRLTGTLAPWSRSNGLGSGSSSTPSLSPPSTRTLWAMASPSFVTVIVSVAVSPTAYVALSQCALVAVRWGQVVGIHGGGDTRWDQLQAAVH